MEISSRPRQRRNWARRTAPTIVLVLCVVSGCAQMQGGSYAPGTAASSAAPESTAGPDSAAAPDTADAAKITIENFKFGPGQLTVPAGATVSVANQDDAPHTVTATDGSFDTGNIDPQGQGTFVAPTKPGTYPYKCSVHPSMAGVLTVT